MADFEENVEKMVGTTREAAGGDSPVGTRPAVSAVSGMRPATRRRRRLVTNEMAATGGVMYADESPYTIEVRHVEEMVGTTREAADGDIVRRGRDGDETGGPGDATGDKTAAAAGDERDGGDRWGNVFGRRGVEFDEDEMAALEG